MKSSAYWHKRGEQIAETQHRKADQYAQRRLKGEYARAMAEIEKEIDVFYSRFALNNGTMSYADAQKILNGNELKDFHMGVERFIELAKDNPDGQWTKMLNNASYKVRVSRLQALQIQMQGVIQNLSMAEDKGLSGLLSDVYTDSYYRTIFEVQKGIGLGGSFARIDLDTLETVIKNPWIGSNFSQRIWGDNNRLVQRLITEFSQALIRGEGARQSAHILADRMNVGYRAAERLVRTETSHIQNEAAFSGYKASGVVKKYEFLSTLDRKTSPICREMDNKVFTLAEKAVGVNFPPLHPYCRSTVVPFFDDEIDPVERLARGSDGEVYKIPDNMTYGQWYKQYVEGKEGGGGK